MKFFRRILESLGPAGVGAVGVALFCAAFYFGTLAPAQAEVARRNKIPEKAISSSNEDGELERFYSRFPRLERLHGELDALYGHARAANVQLLQGDYRLESSAGGLTAYHVTLPVRGSYSQLRQFVGRVLRDMPTASLDALRFERKKAADAQIDAQVRLTIYLRKGT